MTAAFEVGKATAPVTAGGDVADALRQNAETTRKAQLADDKAAAAKEKYLKIYNETRKKTLACRKSQDRKLRSFMRREKALTWDICVAGRRLFGKIVTKWKSNILKTAVRLSRRHRSRNSELNEREGGVLVDDTNSRQRQQIQWGSEHEWWRHRWEREREMHTKWATKLSKQTARPALIRSTVKRIDNSDRKRNKNVGSDPNAKGVRRQQRTRSQVFSSHS